MGEKGAGRVVYFVSIPPTDSDRLSTMLGYALASASMGLDVVLFYALDGALTLKKAVFEGLKPEIKAKFSQCLKAGCRVLLCSSAAEQYGIGKEDVVEGVEIADIETFYDYAAGADVVMGW
ncbi:MAG: DsrE family protein [Thermoproteus sp. AZ2]|uniref:DsrE family protein n=1 Tax=Thermoproteus sp. AZ2 TaxID=1609232 RepID=A0ACC6V0Q7_9CREN|nr:MAG: sulfur reduction protein DsrE [Thermoproteus sp. AZ2]